jgi:prevent-host-death family protein
MTEWNLADAKNRFSEVVNLALTKGPQRIRRRNDQVVVIAAKEYDRLKRKSSTFKEHLLKGPSFEQLDLERDSSSARDISL